MEENLKLNIKITEEGINCLAEYLDKTIETLKIMENELMKLKVKD